MTEQHRPSARRLSELYDDLVNSNLVAREAFLKMMDGTGSRKEWQKAEFKCAKAVTLWNMATERMKDTRTRSS